MGMLSRMSTIVKSKMNRILDSAEDPNETLDFAYEKQLEMLRGVKRGVVEMVAAKRRIQGQASTVQANVDRLSQQAGQAFFNLFSWNHGDLTHQIINHTFKFWPDISQSQQIFHTFFLYHFFTYS